MLTKTEFMNLINKNEVLTAEEEKAIFEYYQNNKTQEVRNLIAMKNHGLIRFVINSCHMSGKNEDDLEQEGMMGLLSAVERFSPEKDTKFSTFAIYWIRSKIMRYFYDNFGAIRTPSNVLADAYRIKKAIENYKIQNKGRTPDMDWLKKETGLEEFEINNIMENAMNNFVSLDQQMNDDDDTFDRYSTIEDPKAFNENNILTQLSNIKLPETIKGLLTEREYDILTSVFGIDGKKKTTMIAIAKEQHVTKERINEIYRRALRKLKMPSSKALILKETGYKL